MALFKLKPIRREDVQFHHALRPRRISFAYSHTDQLKREKRKDVSWVGSFSVPFSKSVEPVFVADTRLKLVPSVGGSGVWHSIRSEDEFKKIEDWISSQGSRVFLRDCMEISIALDQNFASPDAMEYTTLGALEARAKKTADADATALLAEYYIKAIESTGFYRKARFIAAVPPSPDKKRFDLPSALADQIAKKLGLQNLTPRFTFSGTKGTVKSLAFNEKWTAWEKAGLGFQPKLEGSPPVILIDDKYQSGITIQFVASRLRAAGAGPIYGLCAVKTLRDTDNT